jgi:16S rRNA (adenine1518-N6/adenine1519-N6)-dimethyltransferase
MLRNNLQSVIERDSLTQLLEQLGINPQVRAEDLGVAQWVSLVNTIAAVGSQESPSQELGGRN